MSQIPAIGSRAQVWHGNADHTAGGLKKKDLKKNKRGCIVSKRRSGIAKRTRRLEKAGCKTQKGVFKLFTKECANGMKRRTRRTR